jgi:hypothetical protein
MLDGAPSAKPLSFSVTAPMLIFAFLYILAKEPQ